MAVAWRVGKFGFQAGGTKAEFLDHSELCINLRGFSLLWGVRWDGMGSLNFTIKFHSGAEINQRGQDCLH